MASPLDELISLVPPSGTPSVGFEWDAAEEVLGVRLPSDYKRLIETYGVGAFDGFLWILQPRAGNEHLDMLVQRTLRLDALRRLRSGGEQIPYETERGREEILPWATTDNGDVCYWVMRPREEADSWTVTVNEGRGPEWIDYQGTATEFLTACLSRSVRIAVFPDDFPSALPRFAPGGDQPGSGSHPEGA
jgi:hypothetical protein